MAGYEDLPQPISWVQRGTKFINLAIEPIKPVKHQNNTNAQKCKASTNSLKDQQQQHQQQNMI